MVAVASYTVSLWTHGIYGTFDDIGLVMWAGSSGPYITGRSPYQVWEVLVFVLIAIVTGLMGAGFNDLNRRLTVMRKGLICGDRRLRVIEALLSIWLVISVFYLVCFAFPCRQVDESTTPSFDGHHVGDEHGIYLVRFQCAQPNGTSAPVSSFNGMATLLMQHQEGAIKQLFSRSTAGYFMPWTCLLFSFIYFMAAVFVYGVGVPSGLFVPGMLIGGGFGRFVGELVHSWGGQVDPGLYALVGGAGMLGGVTRMTMSLAVIIVELTNDIDLLLPIMLAIGIAKQVGDQFNRGVYDIHIGLQGVPMLETDEIMGAPEAQNVLLNAKSIMATKVVSVSEATSRSKLELMLATNQHNGFPVISADAAEGGSNLFAGIISRSRLARVLQNASVDVHPMAKSAAPAAAGLSSSPAPSPASASHMIDLRPHCDRSPYVVHELLPLHRVFRLFTTMGMRHLVVVDSHSIVVGIITRKDFLKVRDGGINFGRQLSRRREETRRRLQITGAAEVSEIMARRSSENAILSKGASPKASPKAIAANGRKLTADVMRAPGSFIRQLSGNLTSAVGNISPGGRRSPASRNGSPETSTMNTTATASAPTAAPAAAPAPAELSSIELEQP